MLLKFRTFLDKFLLLWANHNTLKGSNDATFAWFDRGTFFGEIIIGSFGVLDESPEARSGWVRTQNKYVDKIFNFKICFQIIKDLIYSVSKLFNGF